MPRNHAGLAHALREISREIPVLLEELPTLAYTVLWSTVLPVVQVIAVSTLIGITARTLWRWIVPPTPAALHRHALTLWSKATSKAQEAYAMRVLTDAAVPVPPLGESIRTRVQRMTNTNSANNTIITVRYPPAAVSLVAWHLYYRKDTATALDWLTALGATGEPAPYLREAIVSLTYDAQALTTDNGHSNSNAHMMVQPELRQMDYLTVAFATTTARTTPTQETNASNAAATPSDKKMN